MRKPNKVVPFQVLQARQRERSQRLKARLGGTDYGWQNRQREGVWHRKQKARDDARQERERRKELQRSELESLAIDKPAQRLSDPVKVVAEIYFQPFKDVPVRALLLGDDGNLYRHNLNWKHWKYPFSQRSKVKFEYTLAQRDLILAHSKVQHYHEAGKAEPIEAKGYQSDSLGRKRLEELKDEGKMLRLGYAKQPTLAEVIELRPNVDDNKQLNKEGKLSAHQYNLTLNR